MLVVKRRNGSDTFITVPPSAEPTQIVVKVIETTYDWTKLGFIAPQEVKILRDDAIKTEAPDDK